MKIAIIGAGWFGCHMGVVLKELGHDITVYEKNTEIFLEGSGYNQYRLHHGFHYPRSYITRTEIQESYGPFVKRYGPFLHNVDQNIYAIVEGASQVDFSTYLLIMDGHELDYGIVDPKKYGLTHVEGAIQVHEKGINTLKCKKYFESLLAKNLLLNTRVSQIKDGGRFVEINQMKYDLAINATYNKYHPISNLPVIYEPFCYLVYERKIKNQDLAITLMDGQFSSLYPYHCGDDKTPFYTLTDVKYGPMGNFKSFKQAAARLKQADKKYAARLRRISEERISFFYPGFRKEFKYVKMDCAIKVKPISRADSRQCFVVKDNRLIHVFSGKFNNVIIAEQKILNIISQGKAFL